MLKFTQTQKKMEINFVIKLKENGKFCKLKWIF